MVASACSAAAVMAALLLTTIHMAIAQTTATALSPAAGTPTDTPKNDYAKYEPNYLVDRYKSHPADFSYGAMKNSSDSAQYMIDHVGETFITFTVIGVLGVIVLMCYNCMTCVKFDKPRKCCWGKGPKCCQKFFSNVTPGPFSYKIECGSHLRCYPCRQLIRTFLLLLAIAIVTLSGTGARINTDQGEALENIPNVLRSVADYIDGPLTAEIYVLGNLTADVSGNLSALIRASVDEFTIVPANLTELFSGASDDVLRILGAIDANVERTTDELSDDMGMVTDSTNDAFWNATADDALGVARDLSDALRQTRNDVANGAAELNDNGRHELIALIISMAIMCTLAMCLFAWVNTGHKRLACTDVLLAPCRKCKCEAHEDSTTRLGCGRDLYRTNCLFSFCGLWFVLVCFVLAGVLFAISTVMADFCAAPTSSIAELVDAAPVTYYLECHTYTDTRLREDFPFNSLAVEIQEAFVDLDTISDNIDDNLRNLGASQSLLTQSAMLSLSVQLLGHGLSNDAGAIWYKGLAGCHHINPFMHELLIDICTGFYSTVALFFELALVLGCLCCILEVCLKCSRRERKEYYNVEQKLRRRRKKRTTAAGDEVSESDSDSDSEIESASSESDDEEPPNERDAKEWTAFNARRKKRASDKIKRQKKRLKNAERRLKKREIRAEQKEKALQKAEKARIAADKAQLNITDKLEKHDITTRHNDAAKAEKVQLKTSKTEHLHHVKDETGRFKDEVKVHKAAIKGEKHILKDEKKAHSAEGKLYKAEKRKIKAEHRVESAEFKHRKQHLKAKHSEAEVQYKAELAAAEATGDKAAIREIKKNYKESGHDYKGSVTAVKNAHRAGNKLYHAEQKAVKKKHHSEAKIYQEHTHVVKGKIKLEKASLHKETKHHKDIVKSEKAQYTAHVAPLKAEQKAERKQMKDQMGSYKTHAKSHQHTLHDETAAMNAERKARKQEDKLRRAKVTATTAVHQHQHHQHHHGDGVVTTQPGRQVKNPAYNTSELPAGTPLDADGDVAYSHIYDEARFGFNSFA